MSRISYNILDEDLIALFNAFDLEFETLDGQAAVPAAQYQDYIDQIEEALEALDDYEDPLWTNWDGIETEIWIWSTEQAKWV